jgi:predicted dehydrogenase
MKSVRLALVGTGFIGRIHWMCYRSLSGIYDSVPARVIFDTVYTSHPDEAQRFEFQRAISYADIAETCRNVDMLDICTPNATHRFLAEAAIAAGRPVYCEKPVDLDGEHVLELARRAEAAGVFNQAGLVYRFLPAMATARAVIRAGIIGDVVTWRTVLLHASYLNAERPMSWRLSRKESGGGALMDLGIHLIDAVRMVVGEFATVQCLTKTVVSERPSAAISEERAHVDVDDWALVTANLTDGSTGTVEVSRVAAGREGAFAFEVYGTRGSVTIDLQRGRAVVMDAGSHDITDRVAVEDPWVSYLRTAYPSAKMSMGLMCDLHAASIYTFLDGCTGGEVGFSARPTLAEAGWTQRVVDACYQSADTGNRVAVQRPQAS